MYLLKNRCKVDGAAKEDVATRNGQFHLSVVKLDGHTFLWRLDDVGKAARQLGRAADALSLPMLTIGSQNAILFVNDALRALVDHRLRSIAALFGDAPLLGGQIRSLQTATDEISVLVAIVEGHGGGRTEAYFLPRPADVVSDATMIEMPEAEWKAIEDWLVPLLKIGPEGALIASNRQARKLLGFSDSDHLKVQHVLGGPGRPIADWLEEIRERRTTEDSQFLRGRCDLRDKFIQVTLCCAGIGDD